MRKSMCFFFIMALTFNSSLVYAKQHKIPSGERFKFYADFGYKTLEEANRECGYRLPTRMLPVPTTHIFALCQKDRGAYPPNTLSVNLISEKQPIYDYVMTIHPVNGLRPLNEVKFLNEMNFTHTYKLSDGTKAYLSEPVDGKSVFFIFEKGGLRYKIGVDSRAIEKATPEKFIVLVESVK